MATLAFMLRDAAISVDSLDKSQIYTNGYPVSFKDYRVQIDSMDDYQIEYDENIDAWTATSETMGGGYCVSYVITKADYERILNTVCIPQPPTA